MKRVMIFLRIISPKETVQKELPESLIDEEILRLTKKVPRTKAEKAFHAWLSDWNKRNKER